MAQPAKLTDRQIRELRESMSPEALARNPEFAAATAPSNGNGQTATPSPTIETPARATTLPGRGRQGRAATGVQPSSPPRRGGPRLPSLPTSSRAQRILIVTWLGVMALRFVNDVAIQKDWPCPGRYIKISTLYLILAFLSEPAPALAMWLGIGFALAFAQNEIKVSVGKYGSFAGVPLGQQPGTPASSNAGYTPQGYQPSPTGPTVTP